MVANMILKSLTALLLILSSDHLARAGGKEAQKTLHTSFFVHLEKGAWAEQNLSRVAMGSSAGWTCKAGEIELSEGTREPGAEVQIYKSASVVCRSENGARIEMLPLCAVGYPDKGGGSVRLYGKGEDFAVMTAECRTVYK